MKNIDFSKAFTPVPPTAHAHTLDTLREVRKMNRKHTKPLMAVVLTAILVLGLIGGAIAAVSGGVLDFMFGRKTPTQEQKDMVQPIGLTHEKGGVKTTLIDALFDGQDVGLGLSLESDLAVYAILEGMTVNGVPVFVHAFNLDQWLRKPTEDAKGTVASRGLCGTLAEACLALNAPEKQAAYDEALRRIAGEGKAEVTVKLSLLTPNIGVQMISGEALYDLSPKQAWDAIDECLSRGLTPIDAYEPYDPMVGSACFADEGNRDTQFSQPLADAESLVEFGNMRLIDAFDFSFTLNVDTGRVTDFAPSEPIQGDDVTVSFKQLRMTPLANTIFFLIHSDVMSEEELRNAYPAFLFFDENKQPLADGVMMQIDSRVDTQPDGTRALYTFAWTHPSETIPKSVSLVPYDPMDGQQSADWARAITVDLSK